MKKGFNNFLKFKTQNSIQKMRILFIIYCVLYYIRDSKICFYDMWEKRADDILQLNFFLLNYLRYFSFSKKNTNIKRFRNLFEFKYERTKMDILYIS